LLSLTQSLVSAERVRGDSLKQWANEGRCKPDAGNNARPRSLTLLAGRGQLAEVDRQVMFSTGHESEIRVDPHFEISGQFHLNFLGGFVGHRAVGSVVTAH
jgi:hypothetical protein